nr:hypothetical protein [uncultured Undibacterium sp.]
MADKKADSADMPACRKLNLDFIENARSVVDNKLCNFVRTYQISQKMKIKKENSN